jgi:hypothetical protein
MKRVVLVVFVLVLGVFAAKEIRTRFNPSRNIVLAQMAPTPSAFSMCEGATEIPTGWIATDERHAITCAYPLSTTVTQRMLVIESYASAQKNLTPMTVCADARVPPGFIVTGFARTPDKCRALTIQPGSPGDLMVKTIRYLPAI